MRVTLFLKAQFTDSYITEVNTTVVLRQLTILGKLLSDDVTYYLIYHPRVLQRRQLYHQRRIR